MASLFKTDREKGATAVQSANTLKQKSEWLQAGDAFCKAAVHYNEDNDHLEAAQCLCDAANCYVKVDCRCAILTLEAAATIYSEQGKFSFAAGLHTQIAEMALSLKRKNPSNNNWLTISGPLDKKRLRQCDDAAFIEKFRQTSRPMPAEALAVEHYEKAAHYYNSERSPANEADCSARMADLLADSGHLVEAAETFEKLAKMTGEHEFLALGAKGYALRACLCRLAAGLELSIDSVVLLCPSLAGSDECALVQGLADAADPAAVDAAVRQFGRLNQVDDWTQRRLQTVREKKLLGPNLA